MLDNKEIYYESLANHIYFANTIRSFCTTIGLTFFKNNQEYIDRAIALGYQSTDIIKEAINIMNKELATDVLTNDIYITSYTKELDLLTEKLFNINLLISIDQDIEILNNRIDIVINEEIMNLIDKLNNKSLSLINEFKEFAIEIKNKMETGNLFSYLYIDFFNYMYDEISVYGRDIDRIMSKNDYTDFYLREFVYYFNELLKKSALYIRGFLDTKDQDIFDMASYYINAFSSLTEKYLKKENNLDSKTKVLVTNYRDFLISIIDKLLKAKTSFITPPLVLDNFLTNINVYLYILNKKF